MLRNLKFILTPKHLIDGAILLWCLSLLLPAMTYDGNTEFGFEVLFSGVLFGWLGLLLQPYSNFIFWLVILLVEKGKSLVKLAAFTLIAGLSSFMLTSITSSGDKGISTSYIMAWGWGAIIWVTAYTLLLLGVIWQANPENSKKVKSWLVIIPLILGTIFLLGRYQFLQANLIERQRYFPFMTAFSPQLPLYRQQSSQNKAFQEGVGQIDPASLLQVPIDKHTVIEVKGEINNTHMLSMDAFKIPLPERFIYQGYAYTHIKGWSIKQAVDDSVKADLVLKIAIPTVHNEKHDKATVSIYSNKQDKLLWQAPLLIQRDYEGGEAYQLPDYPFETWYRPIRNSDLTFDNIDYRRFDFSKQAYQIIKQDNPIIAGNITDHSKALDLTSHLIQMPDGSTVTIDNLDDAQQLEDVYVSQDMVLFFYQQEDIYEQQGMPKIIVFNTKNQQYSVFLRPKITDPKTTDAQTNNHELTDFESKNTPLNVAHIDSVSMIYESTEYNRAMIIVQARGKAFIFESDQTPYRYY